MAVEVRRFVPAFPAVLFLLLICTLAAHADFASQAWVQRFGSIGDSTDQAKKVLADTNGNIFVVGNTDDHLVAQDWLVIKYSTAGAPLWTNRYNSPDNSVDTANVATLDPRGNIIVAGTSGTNYLLIKYSTTNGVPLWTNLTKLAVSAIASDPSGNVIVTGNTAANSDYGTIKYSSNGVPVWTNIYQGAFGNDFPTALVADSSGNVIVTGNSDTGGGTNDFVTIKYSSAGATVWTKSFDGPGNSYDNPTAIAVDSSGNVSVTGNTFNGTNYDWATIRYNSAGGGVSWTKFFSGATNSSDTAEAIAVDSSGNVFVTGSSGVGTNSDLITIKYSNTGTALWTNRYHTAGFLSDFANAIALDTNGNVFVTGRSQLTFSETDFLTLKYSSAGVVLWTNRYHGPSSVYADQAFSIAINTPGEVFVTGTSGASGILGNSDIATIKYSNAGVALWTNRYTAPGHGGGLGNAIALDSSGNAFVTGNSPNSSTLQMATIKYATNDSPLWTNFFNGSSNSYDLPVAVVLDAPGDVFITGNTVVGNSYDFAALKYSSAGLLLWSNLYDGPAGSNDIVMAAATDGTNLFVTGSSYTTATNMDYATIKYSSEGAPLWTNRFDSGGSDQPRAIGVDAGGNVFVTGFPAAVKYSNSGVALWTNLFSFNATTMALDPAGNLIVVGSSGSQQLVTAKYSSAGSLIWSNSYNSATNVFGTPADYPQAVATDRNGNIFIAGYTDPYRFGSGFTYLTLAYSSSGVPLWTNSSVAGRPAAIAVDLAGNVFISGPATGAYGNNDYTTIVFSNSGIPLSTNQYNGPANGDDSVLTRFDLVTGTDGSIFVTGGSDGNFSNDPNYGKTYDFATVKYVYGMGSAVTAQPLSRTNFVGSAANFSVTPAGTPPFYYQWLRNGTNLLNGGNISGATTNLLTISNVALADAANYSVIVTNAYGSTISSIAVLSVPPVSSVLPLPSSAGPWFLVQWSGHAAANGTLRFDVYASTNGSTFTLWQSNTSSTNAGYRGAPGQSYYFYSIARDSAGLQESKSASAEAQTTVPSTAPVLTPIASVTNNPGQALIFTNSLLNGTPVGNYVFSLDPGAPAGSAITSSNGVFTWTPNCSQASTINLITVRVTDSGQTNLTDALTFVTTVTECVSPQLGRVVMAVGDTNRVPINLISSVPLTNLTMRLLLAQEHLTNISVQPIVPQICASGVQPITNGQYLLSFGTCSNQFLIGTQQVAWLNFTAVSNQSSAFVPLNLDQITGREPNGFSVANFAPQAGRVVVVGLEPLLEALLDTNQLVTVTLYASVNSSSELSIASSLSPPANWSTWQQVIMTNLFRDFPAPGRTNQTQLFRAIRHVE